MWSKAADIFTKIAFAALIFFAAAGVLLAATTYVITKKENDPNKPVICKRVDGKQVSCHEDIDIKKGKDGVPQGCFQLDGKEKCVAVADFCKANPQNSQCAQIAQPTVYRDIKECPKEIEKKGCTDGKTPEVQCGSQRIQIPYLFFNTASGAETPTVAVTCGATQAKVTLRQNGRVVAERETCPTNQLTGGGAISFIFQPLSREEYVKQQVADARRRGLSGAALKKAETDAATQSPGTWRIACSPDDRADTDEALRSLDPNTAKSTNSQEELARKAQENPNESFRHDIDGNRRVVARCDSQGKCTYQTFEKDEQGNWVPASKPIPIEKDKLDEAMKGINSPEAFDRIGRDNPPRPSGQETKTPPPDPKTRADDPRPPQNDNNSFRPTSSSSNPSQQGQQPKQQPQQGGQQQQPQQYPQQQQQNIPAPYCAGIKASKSEITEGEQVTIQWSIPYAIRYELRGGSGNINGSTVTVRPKETTAYSVVGYGIPGAGQNYGGYGQYGQQYGQQQSFGQYDTGMALDGSSIYGGTQQQYGYQQQQYPYPYPQQQYGAQQQSCGIPGAACCGPVTVTVKPKKIVTRDVIVDDSDEEEEEPEDDYTEQKPEIRCTPKDMEEGKSATVVWSCPDGSRRATSLAKHLNGTPLAETESFYVEGKTSGSQKVYPQSATIYAVRCISTKGKRSGTSSCSVRTVPRVNTPMRTGIIPVVKQSPTSDMKLSIVADPVKIRVSSQEVTISWRATQVDSCVVTGPNGYKQETTQGSVSGTSDKPGPLTFTLTCKKGTDTRTRSVKVDVE